MFSFVIKVGLGMGWREGGLNVQGAFFVRADEARGPSALGRRPYFCCRESVYREQANRKGGWIGVRDQSGGLQLLRVSSREPGDSYDSKIEGFSLKRVASFWFSVSCLFFFFLFFFIKAVRDTQAASSTARKKNVHDVW